jgi:hypothetical protein
MDGKVTTAGGFMIGKKGGADYVVVVSVLVEILIYLWVYKN